MDETKHKTFISYKYDEAQDLRDEIIDALGDEYASYYMGETADSPDLTDESTEKIKDYLKDMMYNTSVTIVLLSPNMKKSKWIDWEIEYCLKEIKRKNRTSLTNGVVAVIQKVNGDYSWFRSEKNGKWSYDSSKLYPIICNNHCNVKDDYKKSSDGYDVLMDSYISYISEEDFLSNPIKYIDNAFDKSEKSYKYDLCKTSK